MEALRALRAPPRPGVDGDWFGRFRNARLLYACCSHLGPFSGPCWFSVDSTPPCFSFGPGFFSGPTFPLTSKDLTRYSCGTLPMGCGKRSGFRTNRSWQRTYNLLTHPYLRGLPVRETGGPS